MKRDLIVATLSVSRTFDDVETTPESLSVKGTVFERSVEERTLEGVAGAPVLQRRYRIRFADRARVLWEQHFPKALYVDPLPVTARSAVRLRFNRGFRRAIRQTGEGPRSLSMCA
jgi:hypothetical protein